MAFEIVAAQQWKLVNFEQPCFPYIIPSEQKSPIMFTNGIADAASPDLWYLNGEPFLDIEEFPKRR
jgi:hypothetical protein